MTNHGDAVACHVCGARGVPIAYGLPGEEMFRAAERGEIVLGGCCIGPATHRCERGHEWVEPEPIGASAPVEYRWN